MDPITTVLLIQVAMSFAGGLGAGLAKKVFGDDDGAAERKEIIRRLEDIRKRIIVLTALVKELPARLRGEIDEALVDDAYRSLEFVAEKLAKAVEENIAFPIDAAFQVEIATKWQRIAELEVRLNLLVSLPYYTEIFRIAVVQDFDEFVRDHIAAKFSEVDELWNIKTSELNANLQNARAILATRYFRGGSEVLPKSPYFQYQLRPAPTVSRMTGGRDQREYIEEEDPKYLRSRNRQIARLRDIGNEIERLRGELTAIYPVKEDLYTYLKLLPGSGRLYVPD